MNDRDEWDGWIGRRFVSTTRLDPWLANHLAVTLDRDPTSQTATRCPRRGTGPIFHDLVRASAARGRGSPRGRHRHATDPLPRRMWAGGSSGFEAPLVLGSTVERVSTIRDIVAKQGRSGPWCS